jgi:hypothetical protein
VLSEKHRQGQTVHIHKVAACRLPWHFRLGKRPNGRAVCVAPAGGTVAPRNGAENSREQRPVTGDPPTLRPCVERAPWGNAREPLVQSTLALPLSEGEPQLIPNLYSPTCTSRFLQDSDLIARPSTVQRKRRWDAAELEDRDPQTAAGGRQVRPRFSVGARNETSSTRPNPPRPHPAAAVMGHEANTAQRGPNTSGGPSAFPAVLVTSLGPLPPYPPEPESEPTLESPNHHAAGSQQWVGPETRGSGNGATANLYAEILHLLDVN